MVVAEVVAGLSTTVVQLENNAGAAKARMRMVALIFMIRLGSNLFGFLLADSKPNWP